jgi:hypothetical protein
MECSLSNSADTWSCKISLRFDYGSGNLSGRSQAFGAAFTDRSHFEISLRRAQAAILSPHLPSEIFLLKSQQELKAALRDDPRTLKFSKNTVVVDILDPDATNLSFVDLPGLIQNESQDVIDIVRNLVEDYIGRQETLILITIPMSDDMENQQAVRLARDADPQGERTIGVLTKPDTITTGSVNARQMWRQVLEGQSHTLAHGYYCVRLPDDVDRARNPTRAKLQQVASNFFDTTPPWNEIADRSRLGIPGLVSYLSTLLVRLIERSLPKLKQDVEQLIDDCVEKLGRLPAPITNDPHTEILGRITRFCATFQGAVYGSNEEKGLVQANRAHYETFEKDIRETAPNFVPSTSLHITSDSDSLDVAPTNITSEPLNLNDVRKVIKNSITWHLPRNIPFEAKKILIVKFIERWHRPSLLCFDAVFSNLSDFVERLTDTHFGRFKQLERHIRQLVRTEIENGKAHSLKSLEKSLERETMPLFAGGDTDYNIASARWLDFYKEKRSQPPEVSLQRALNALAAIGYLGLTIQDLSRLAPRDQFEDELVVMADVRGYFEVAYKRIIHSIPMTIEHSLTQPLANGLQDSLLNSIFAEPNATEKMRSLLSEETDIASRRDTLELQKARLLEIQERLHDFGL